MIDLCICTYLKEGQRSLWQYRDSSHLISLKHSALKSTLKPQEETNLTSLSSTRSLSALHLSHYQKLFFLILLI